MKEQTRAISTEAHLTLLVLAIVGPLIVFGAVALWHFAQSERARLDSDVRNAARSLAVALDREFEGKRSALRALALSDNLRRGDFAAFHRQASEFGAQEDVTIVLRDLAGQQLVNTRVPWGTALPEDPRLLAAEKAALSAGTAVVTNVFEGPLAAAPAVAILLPIRRDGEAAYFLRLTAGLARVDAVLRTVRIPPGWTALFVDGAGVVAARSEAAERFVGRMAPEGLREAMGTREGEWYGVDLVGRRVVSSFAASSVSDWRAVVTVPERLVEQPLYRTLLVLLALGAVVVVLSFLFAVWLGRRLAAPLAALAADAGRMGRGEVVAAPRSGVAEVNVVGEAIAAASVDLKRRRDELERLNSMLEARVRERTAEVEQARDALQAINRNLEAIVAARVADLKAANDEIQRFAYIVSHDLRAPLVNVMGFTSELDAVRGEIERFFRTVAEKAPDLAGEDVRAAVETDLPEALGFIRASTAKMDRLINAILKLSREGRRVLTPEPLAVRPLLEGIAGSLTHQLDASGTELVVEDVPDLVTDRLAVEQIFSNLIENAIKYLEPGRPGRVVVRGREFGPHARYEVEDNGRGIEPKDFERIFDLFRRAGAQTQPGEGIGLAHVRALVRRLGGTITVESEFGRGSTFIVTVPKVLQPSKEAA